MESTSNLWELIRLRTPTPKSKPSNMGGTCSPQKNVQLPKKSKQQKQLYALGIQSRENGNGTNFYSLITHPRNCVNLPAVKLHVLFHKKYIPPVHTHTHTWHELNSMLPPPGKPPKNMSLKWRIDLSSRRDGGLEENPPTFLLHGFDHMVIYGYKGSIILIRDPLYWLFTW